MSLMDQLRYEQEEDYTPEYNYTRVQADEVDINKYKSIDDILDRNPIHYKKAINERGYIDAY